MGDSGCRGLGAAGCFTEVGGAGADDQLVTQQAAIVAADPGAATEMAYNLQYQQLQSQMQSENRSFTAVSNIMKTKHDTVKSTISNIR